MAAPKYSRIGERPAGPSGTLILVGSLLVAALFIGAWVFTTPAAIPNSPTDEIQSFNSPDSKPHPEESPNVEQSPTEEKSSPAEESPAEESPVDDSAAAEESPAEEAASEESPSEKAPSDESPAEEAASEESPAEEAASEESPSEEAPSKESPVEEAASEESPSEEASSEESPAEEAASEKSPAEEAASEESPAEEAASDESPAEEAAAEETKEPSTSEENTEENAEKAPASTLPEGINSDAELDTETRELNSTKFKTQVEESQEENKEEGKSPLESVGGDDEKIPEWKLCTFKGAQDYIPCLDNEAAIKNLTSTKHYEHRERHCPSQEDLLKCLVPLPSNYKVPIKWPESRDAVWFSNVPYTELASYKSDQNWVKVSETKQKLIFPGGGTQFKTERGALHYIEYIEKIVPDVAWGKHVRTVLDVGCGVASFGGYLFDKNVVTMSLAPKDEHEAQIQFALERGIPAINSVMGTQRLVFPSNVYDVVHCARCRVPWEMEGGMLLLELNRLLRPGGFFIWSATPVYWDDEENTRIWNDTSDLLSRMQWTKLTKSIDPDTKVGVAIFQKPKDNNMYALRSPDALPPFCEKDDKPDAAWYVPMKACMHKIPTGEDVRGTSWPSEWPLRVESTPAWLSSTEAGVFGKPAAEDFRTDTDHWKHVVHNSYMQGLDIEWTSVRKVMDMKAGYGGFAAALITLPLWTMNIIPVTEPDTLPIIFDRGLIGMYHDWCEPHSTYPRSYDVMHADHLLSTLPKRCKTVSVVQEMDRILRPDGWAIFRDSADLVVEVEAIARSLHWDIVVSSGQGEAKLLVAQKKFWRPEAALEAEP